MVEHVWMTPWGEEYNLTTGNQGVRLEQGGAENLPRAQAERNGVTVVGRAGERPTDLTIPKAEGSFTVSCFAHGGLSAGEVESRFKAGFSHHHAGWYILRGWAQGDLQLRATLAGFSAPTRQAHHGSFTRLTVDLDGPRGLWDQHHSDYVADGSSEVEIYNPGDAVIHPRVRWQEQSTLIMPSQAETTLPHVPEERVLVLDAAESCVVVDDAGQVDYTVWGSFPVYPEGVPVGGSRVYRASPGVTFEWSVGYLDPWK